MSKSADEVKTEARTKLMLSLPESTANLVRHVAVEEKRDISDLVAELIHKRYPGQFVFQPAISA